MGVSAGLLTILVLKVHDLDGVIPAHHHLRTLSWLAAAVVMTFIGIVLSAWRWQRVLVLFDAKVPIRTLTSHYLAGLFVGNVLPSTIGGDVVRVARGSQSTGSSTTAFASVVLERLTGMVALPLLVLIGLALRPSQLHVKHAWTALLVALITLAGLAVVLFLAGHPRLAGRYTDNTNWTRFIGAIHLGVDRMRRQPRHAGYVLLTAVVYQVSVVISVLLIFNALDLGIPIVVGIAYIPAVSMVQVLPISLSGLGVREGMLVWLLQPMGANRATAIAAGLLWFFCTLVVSFVGVPMFAMGGRRKETVTEGVV
jgi:glycosyltransferase 2 family protein